MNRTPRLLLATRGISKNSTLSALLPDFEVVGGRIGCMPRNIDYVASWGFKPSYRHAAVVASELQKTILFIEDGFLRSVDLGDKDPTFSIVVDYQGIYYHAGRPSDLENYIQRSLSLQQIERARSLCRQWRDAGVSKYNHLRDWAGMLPEDYVLVADQTYGDSAIEHGQASEKSFQAMLQAALSDFPSSTVLVKIHPDVFAGRKRGHFNAAVLKKNPRIQVIADDVHPVTLLQRARAIYVVTSQMGFEGLLWGKPVHVFGMPFYAGYGLTHDRLPAPDRRSPVTLEQLVYGALIEYARYLDPESGQLCQPERLISWMKLQRTCRARFPKEIFAPGYSSWKRPIVKDFFQGSAVRFVNKVGQCPNNGVLALWGRNAASESFSGQVIRLEDGFMRSVGLGVDLIRPLSWVMDTRGIYYDATCVSDLEFILQYSQMSPDLLRRAQHLRERIVSENLTKYNVGTGGWVRPEQVTTVILVPGQVETDASIRFGSTVIRGNLALLKAVRLNNPDAYIVYKPHPDVAAGMRDKGKGEAQVGQWCDEIVQDLSIGQLFTEVDEVHVLTSLAGFEALMRGKRVVTYGRPFYAGWSLTEDRYPVSRRTRKRSLDELTAAALILYPTYVSRRTHRFTTVEVALDELLLWKVQGASVMPSWRKALRPLLGLIARLRGKR
ncbi:capsular polysaccharide biosynthesis protein [Advenella sp. FME57]|uniref:capsular polysaccharide biosynthesis protein n=1 Tax=Advenella sp. FME57 TaxID=2742604 RepID=UPI0018668910|nr:capsular polysaccharide biosynthesis protein [Advenella sp. FME57]